MTWIKRAWSWVQLRRKSLAITAAISCAAVLCLILFKSWQPPEEDESVVLAWNDTIAKLGIDPVFPPEEDIYVGDIFAVITGDRRPNAEAYQAQPLLNRSIKLAHVDMTSELVANYKMLPVFPATGERPNGEHKPWPQPISGGDIFTHPDKRLTLALAAFPGFTIKHARKGEGGVAGLGGRLFGIRSGANELIELKIPFAETYGVPSVKAAGVLSAFCADEYTAPICTDEALRKHLSFVTPGMLDTAVNPKTGRRSYLVDVEIALVSRVYLVRSIEQTRTLSRDRAAQLQVARNQEKPSQNGPAPAVGSGETGRLPEEQAGAADKAMTATFGQLNTSIPGGNIRVQATDENSYSLQQIFERPVAIGYRAVRTAFPTVAAGDMESPR